MSTKTENRATKKAADIEQQRLRRMQKYASYRKKQSNEEHPEHFKSTLNRLLALLLKYRFGVILVLLAASASTVLSIFSPDLMGDVIDLFKEQIDLKLAGTITDMDFSAVIQVLLKIFGIYFTSSILMFIQQYTLAGVTQKFVCAVREKINFKFSKLPLRFFDRYTKGELLSRIVNDCDNLSNTLQSNMTTVLTSAIQVVGVCIYMFILNWQMALISIILVPISTFITRVIAKRSKILFRQHWDRLGEMNGHIEEMYTGHNIVKIFNREKESVEEFNDIADQLCDVTVKANFVSGLINPILKVFSNLNYVAICFFGAWLIVQSGGDAMKLGMVVAFISYSSMFSSPINNIAKIINTIQSALASAERVFEVLDETEMPADNALKVIDEPKGAVEFRDVSFRYVEDKPLIDDLNISVKPGELVAIVGPTGAGKTTIVNLLMRFYDVDSGAILVDGADIREITRKNLRDEMGMVLQDTWLFKGSVRDNIAYGKENATDEEIVAAAKAAMIHDYIESLPEGYNTVLDEDGTNISQGQRQLLTIARAILSDPAIMILDEATSSVDTRTEVKIQQAMKVLMSGRTNFVIAHRLSTIRNADCILVMRRGSIVEQGTHEQLLAAEGFYAQLYNSQYTGGIPPEDTE